MSIIHQIDETVTLHNGHAIPGFGMGVFQIPADATAENVQAGIAAGYRLIDTAQIYGNEAGTGAGIRAALAEQNLSRSDLFITSKVWNNYLTYDETLAAFEASLEKLGLAYLDLYLIHWPGTQGEDAFKASWQALETLYEQGKIKSIGVSNFEIAHFEKLFAFAKVKPVLNQIEYHPTLDQTEVQAYAAKHGIVTQAWSPLAQGKLFNEVTLAQIAAKHGRSQAQILLRWVLQHDVLVVTKALNETHLRDNALVFDFNLDADDMRALDQLTGPGRVGPDPATFNFN